MKVLRRVFVVIIVLGLVFKLFRWPGGNEILLLGFGSLSIWKLVDIIFTALNSTIDSTHKSIRIVANTAQLIGLIGLLFKLFHWPGANFMLLVFILYSSLIIVWGILVRNKLNWKQLKIPALNFFSMTVLSVFLILTPLKTLLQIQYFDDPKMAKLKYLHFSQPESEEHKLNLETYLNNLRNNSQ